MRLVDGFLNAPAGLTVSPARRATLRATEAVQCFAGELTYSPSIRPMISFWISVVPP